MRDPHGSGPPVGARPDPAVDGTEPPVARAGAQVARAVVLTAVCNLPSFLVSALVPQIRQEFDLGDVAVGAAFSAFWVVASLTAVPCAWLSGRLGPAAALRLAGGLVCAVCAVVALAARSDLGLVLILASGGVAAAIATPAVNIVIMSVVRSGHRAFAFAVASACPVLGLMAAGAIAPVLGGPLGWRGTYLAVAVLAVLCALLVRSSDGRRARPAARPAKPEPARLRPLVVMMAGVAAGNAGIGASTAFLVVAAPSSGVGHAAAAVAVSVASGVSLVFRLLLGGAVDRRGRDPMLLVSVLMLAGAVGFVFLATGAAWAFFVGLALVLVPGWAWISLLNHGVIARYPGAVAAASGVVQTVFFIGGVIGPAAIGAVIGLASYQAAWWTLVAATTVAAVSVLLGRRRLPAFPAARGEEARTREGRGDVDPDVEVVPGRE